MGNALRAHPSLQLLIAFCTFPERYNFLITFSFFLSLTHIHALSSKGMCFFQGTSACKLQLFSCQVRKKNLLRKCLCSK